MMTNKHKQLKYALYKASGQLKSHQHELFPYTFYKVTQVTSELLAGYDNLETTKKDILCLLDILQKAMEVSALVRKDEFEARGPFFARIIKNFGCKKTEEIFRLKHHSLATAVNILKESIQLVIEGKRPHPCLFDLVGLFFQRFTSFCPIYDETLVELGKDIDKVASNIEVLHNECYCLNCVK